MKKHLYMLALAASLFVTGCSETQYAAHLAKQVMGPTDGSGQSEKSYKVGKPYQIAGQTYIPQETFSHTETGIASWYGPGFHGKRTANGERFDSNELTAAHRTLQMPSLVKVTNLDNGKSVVVRVNDRGPFSKGRVIDVSERAAELLGFKNHGTAKVKLELMPEASRSVASKARQGISTKGYEVAINNGTYIPPAQREPIATVPVQTSTSSAAEVPGHVTSDGLFVPDAVVTQSAPETLHDRIFVQAGSFSHKSSAEALSQRLAAIGPSAVYPAQVNGQSFYRVRVGPFADVAPADRALTQVVTAGQGDARLIVD